MKKLLVSLIVALCTVLFSSDAIEKNDPLDNDGGELLFELYSNAIATMDYEALEKNPELCFRMRDHIVTTLVGGKVMYQRARA